MGLLDRAGRSAGLVCSHVLSGTHLLFEIDLPAPPPLWSVLSQHRSPALF